MMVRGGSGNTVLPAGLGLLLWFVVLSSACGQAEPLAVDGSRLIEPTRRNTRVADPALRVAIGSMVTPAVGFSYYQGLLGYLEQHLVSDIQFIDRDNYAELNELLRSGDVDVAFVCAGPYVIGHDDFGLVLLAAPQVRGEVHYRSYIIVARDDPARSLEDLRGRSFAFAEPRSNTGALVPRYLLAMRGERPESFFSWFGYSYAHDRSIRAVARGIVDAAAVDSLIWEHEHRNPGGLARKTRVLERSAPYGIPPVVASPKLSPEVRAQVRQVLLSMHEDPAGRRLLEGMMIERFVATSDSAYDSVRSMLRNLAAAGKSGSAGADP